MLNLLLVFALIVGMLFGGFKMIEPGTRIEYVDGRKATVVDYKKDEDFLLRCKDYIKGIRKGELLILFDEPIARNFNFYPYYLVYEGSLKIIEEENISENNKEDVCKKCGTTGKINGMACICSGCGNIIWGC